jgi:putative ABC transport system permease protein
VAIRHLDGVRSVAVVAAVANTYAYRNDRVPPGHTASLTVRVADSALLSTTRARLSSGFFPDGSRSSLPLVVLGAGATHALGDHGRIVVGGRWFTVAGVLAPHPLLPELDTSVLVSPSVASEWFEYRGTADRIYVRTSPDLVMQVSQQLARAADPIDPTSTEVTRPSDAVAARLAVKENNRALLLGLGAVALLVGILGIANTMVISVVEQRSRIGLRRTLGATRMHIAVQFVCEAFALSLLGGAAGILVGWGITFATTWQHRWSPTINAGVAGAALAVAAIAGVLAGAYPAARAARLAPTDALRAA